MEKLADSGRLAGVIDVTTTEICDHLLGGVLSAGPDRLGAIARTRLPYVGSVGALDMVNFGALETVPAQFRARNLYKHNPQVTLMRTTPRRVPPDRRMDRGKAQPLRGAGALSHCRGRVSALDAPGGAFFDPEADAALFDALQNDLRVSSDRRVLRFPLHINDPAFSDAIVESFVEVAGS